jgi:hypothetical protein
MLCPFTNLFRQFAEVNHKQSNATDIILQCTITLSPQGNLLFQFTDNFFKIRNKPDGLLNNSKTRFFSLNQNFYWLKIPDYRKNRVLLKGYPAHAGFSSTHVVYFIAEIVLKSKAVARFKLHHGLTV